MPNSMPPNPAAVPSAVPPAAQTPPTTVAPERETTPPAQGANASTASTPALTPEEALRLFQRDPVGFIHSIVEMSAERHLSDLKEKAELNGALNVFRKAHPEVAAFEPFILQEVADLIRNDDDGVIAPWHTLLEDGLARFQEKFQTFIRENPDFRSAGQAATGEVPYMEGASARQASEPEARFTRAQIAGMSLKEFLKNEAAINEALKNNRIQ
ncbi:MAG: hypothetical protein AB7P76_05175 [Candidatus Melainabacteria bacterium]